MNTGIDAAERTQFIFISKKVSSFIPDGTPVSPYVCYVTEHIVKKISECITTHEGNLPIYALVLAASSEYHELRNYISMFDQHEFCYAFCLFADDSFESIFTGEHDISYLSSHNLNAIETHFAIESGFRLLEERFRAKKNSDEYLARLLDMKQDQESLVNIGRSLSIEKNTEKLLRLILRFSKVITGADAGSIYIIEELDDKTKQIRFKYSHTFSKEIPLEEFVIPYNTESIAGYVAVTGKILNIHDCYKLASDAPIAFNDSFDKKNHYRSQSMLVIPMRSHIGDIIGVIQLINSKKSPNLRNSTGNEAYEIMLSTETDFETKVFAFEKRYEDIMESVAGQAAIAIENSRLFDQIQNQFEEFVRASVKAIESRDPATSGHSFRVAEICKRMAARINKERKIPFAEISFSNTQLKELEYAALLHDFGKVYISLSIFKKAKKLFPGEFDNLMLKLDFLYRTIELQYQMRMNEALLDNTNEHKESFTSIESEMNRILCRIKEIKSELCELNEPTPLEEDPNDRVKKIENEIAMMHCFDISGASLTILTEKEKENLSIAKGSLNEHERSEIESHVVHTYNFVNKIPWPAEFKNIPKIALMHHEKMDGSGYPNGLKGDDIPIQAKMMAIADIYDALTSGDRPYKRALTHERAIEIIKSEASAGKLDANLVDLFLSCNITHDNISVQSE